MHRHHATKPTQAIVRGILAERFVSRMNCGMKTGYTYWQDGSFWLGYLDEFPDYCTQGETFEDLLENLRDLWRDLTAGAIPNVRRHAELAFA